MRWESPYFDNGVWLRGSFHTHTTVSDGLYSPRETVEYYEKMTRQGNNPGKAYRFLALTDHTTNAKKALFEIPASSPDFAVIEGREDSYGHHIVGVGCKMTFGEDIVHKGYHEYTDADNQRVIDRIIEDGGIAILAHPHWSDRDYWTGGQAARLTGYHAIEIINGDLFSGPAILATDVWDAALSAGRRVWGVGNDDFHGVRDYHNAWNMVLAKSCAPEYIVDALKRGSLYASNGACFERLSVDGAWIIAQCQEDEIYRDCEKTFRFIGQGGKLVQLQMGKNGFAAYRATGSETYIRVELSLNWGYAAFSQPFFLEKP